MLIKFNVGSAISTWNNYSSASIPIATLVANLNDDAGNPTGIALSSNYANSLSDSTSRATSDHFGLPEVFWEGIGFDATDPVEFQLTGLSAYTGQSYTITVAGFSNSASVREMDFSVDGGTAQRYTSPTSEPPNSPLTFTGTISANTMVITSTVVTGLAVFNGFTIDISSSDSIDSIDDPVLDGETGNAFTYTGFASGAPDAFTLDGVTVSGSAAGGSGTFDNVDIAALDTDDSGQVVPQFGTVVFNASNGTESANTNTTNSVKAGWTATTVASIDTVTASYLYQLITTQLPTLPAPANGDVWYFPTTGTTSISAAGGITTDLTTFTFQYIHDVAGTLTAYTITWTNGSLASAGTFSTKIGISIGIGI